MANKRFWRKLVIQRKKKEFIDTDCSIYQLIISVMDHGAKHSNQHFSLPLIARSLERRERMRNI